MWYNLNTGQGRHMDNKNPSAIAAEGSIFMPKNAPKCACMAEA